MNQNDCEITKKHQDSADNYYDRYHRAQSRLPCARCLDIRLRHVNHAGCVPAIWPAAETGLAGCLQVSWTAGTRHPLIRSTCRTWPTTPVLLSLPSVAPWHPSAIQVCGTAARLVESCQPLGVCACLQARWRVVPHLLHLPPCQDQCRSITR